MQFIAVAFIIEDRESYNSEERGWSCSSLCDRETTTGKRLSQTSSPSKTVSYRLTRWFSQQNPFGKRRERERERQYKLLGKEKTRQALLNFLYFIHYFKVLSFILASKAMGATKTIMQWISLRQFLTWLLLLAILTSDQEWLLKKSNLECPIDTL